MSVRPLAGAEELLQSISGRFEKAKRMLFPPPNIKPTDEVSRTHKDEPKADYGVSMKTVLESIEPKNDKSSIKILSYNVWFREDLEMQKRMEEIGDLIHLHSPAIKILSLQEVTPEIYDIFQNSSWWRIYQCSVSRQMAYSKAYGCMLVKITKTIATKPTSSGNQLRYWTSPLWNYWMFLEPRRGWHKSIGTSRNHLINIIFYLKFGPL